MADELLTPGKGRFLVKIAKSTDKDGVQLETKKGDRKVMLVIDVWDCNNKKGVVFEHLTMNIAWKVQAICKACRQPDVFVSDAYCLDRLDELEGLGGECIVGHSEPSNGYDAKTTITKYIVPKESKAKNVVQLNASANFPDDDLPF